MDQKSNKPSPSPSYDILKKQFGDLNQTGSSRNTSTADKNIVRKDPTYSFALGSVELVSAHPEIMEKLKKTAFPGMLANSVYIIPEEENMGFGRKRPNFLYHFINMVNQGKTDVYNTLYTFGRNGIPEGPEDDDSYHITLTGLQILNALQNSSLTRIKNSYIFSDYKEKSREKELNKSEIRQATGKDLITGQQEGDVGGFDELYTKLQHVKAIESAAHSIYSKLQHYHSVAPPELKPGETNNFNDIASTAKRSEAEVENMPVNIAVKPNKAVSPEETENLIASIVKTLDKAIYTINTGLKSNDNGDSALDVEGRERAVPISDTNYNFVARIFKTLKDDLVNKTDRASFNRTNGARNAVATLSDFKEKIVNPLNQTKVTMQKSVNNIENTYSDVVNRVNDDDVDQVAQTHFADGDFSGRQKIYVSALAAANLTGDNVKGLANHIDYFMSSNGVYSFMVPEKTENVKIGPHWMFHNGTIKHKVNEVIVITPEWIEKTKNNVTSTDDTPTDEPNRLSVRRFGKRNVIDRDAIEREFAKKLGDERFDYALEKSKDKDPKNKHARSEAAKYVNAVMREFFLWRAMELFANDANGFKIEANNPLNFDDAKLQEIALGVNEAMQSKDKRDLYVFNRRMKKALVSLRIDPEHFSGTFNLFLKDNMEVNVRTDTSEIRKKILTNLSQLAFIDWDSEDKNKIHKLEKSDQEAVAKLILAVGRFLRIQHDRESMLKEIGVLKMDLAQMVAKLICFTIPVTAKSSGKTYQDLESLLCRLILTYDASWTVKSSDGGVCTNKAYKTLRDTPEGEETPKRKYFIEVADMVNNFIEVYLVRKDRIYLRLIDRINNFIEKHGEAVETINSGDKPSAATNKSKKETTNDNTVEERGQNFRRQYIANMMREMEKSKQAEANAASENPMEGEAQ